MIAPKRPESLADAKRLMWALALWNEEHRHVDRLCFDTISNNDLIATTVGENQILLNLNWQGCLSLADLLLRLAVSDRDGEHVHANPGVELALWSEQTAFYFMPLDGDLPAADHVASLDVLINPWPLDIFRRMEAFLQFDYRYREVEIVGNQLGLRVLASRLVDMAISGRPDQTQMILTPGAQLDEESFEARIRLVSLGWDEHIAMLPAESVARFPRWAKDDLASFRSIWDARRAGG
ncbi:MAG: hypothetical protein M3Y37_00055 [Chloroflexota bacterium]|nr:hypothetical protein [Chloroflexota bacterium]